MSVDLGNIRFLCGWYDLWHLNEDVTKLSKLFQTQQATKDNFLQMAVDYLVVLACSSVGLGPRASVFPVCSLSLGTDPDYAVKHCQEFCLKESYIVELQSPEVSEWSGVVQLCWAIPAKHAGFQQGKGQCGQFDLWRHLPVCWNYGWRCLWRSSGKRKSFGCSCGWLGECWMMFGSELQVADRHKLYSIIIDYSIRCIRILMSSYHRIKSKLEVW